MGGEDREIVPFQRNKGGGSQAIMEKEVMGDLEMMQPANTEYFIGTMEGLIEAVRSFDGSPAAIGYTVYYYAEDMNMADGLKLLKVDGVGAKGALKIMSGISPQQLTQALDGEDLAQLERLPGVGKKTAQKMMLALKGKLSFGDSPVPRSAAATSRWQDVVQALVDMGYDKRDCEAVLARLEQELALELKDKAPSQQEEFLFRRAIVELA